MSVAVDVVVEAPGWSALDLEGLAARAVAATADHLGLTEAEVAILACDDGRISALNGDFRQRDRPTNVLSWPSQERAATEEGGRPRAPDEVELGDIAIAWETCAAEAEAAGIPLADHVAHLVVHATLHLLGYDHILDGDAALMEGVEIEILGKMGLSDPYSR